MFRELGDSATVYKCHFGLGLLYQKERHTALAQTSFEAALDVARQLRDRGKEADTLKEIAQVVRTLTYTPYCALSCPIMFEVLGHIACTLILTANTG